MGKDETIEFEDYLNGKNIRVVEKRHVTDCSRYTIDPAMSTDLLDVHAAMEHKLKLKV